jgi:signal peptidase II
MNKSLESAYSKLYALRFWSILGTAGAVWVADRFSKWWILRHFRLGESRSLLPYFSITFVENTGTAFGFLQGNNRVLLVSAFVILVVLIYGARGLSERGGLWGALGVALVLGGALGNLFDRIHYGQVIDFLDFHVWPVFNVADSAITVGTLSLMIGLWKKK